MLNLLDPERFDCVSTFLELYGNPPATPSTPQQLTALQVRPTDHVMRHLKRVCCVPPAAGLHPGPCLVTTDAGCMHSLAVYVASAALLEPPMAVNSSGNERPPDWIGVALVVLQMYFGWSTPGVTAHALALYCAQTGLCHHCSPVAWSCCLLWQVLMEPVL